MVLTRDAEGALTLLIRNTGYAVSMQAGEDVEEYSRLYTVAAADVPRMVEAWLRDSGDRHRPQAQPIEKLAFSVARLIMGDLAPDDEGSAIASRFIACLTAHAIPHRSEEEPPTDYHLKRLLR